MQVVLIVRIRHPGLDDDLPEKMVQLALVVHRLCKLKTKVLCTLWQRSQDYSFLEDG
jgi:hypothetical protein